jgi:hypothetical protein
MDSRIPSHLLAGVLEGSKDQDLLIRDVRADMDANAELAESLRMRSR